MEKVASDKGQKQRGTQDGAKAYRVSIISSICRWEPEPRSTIFRIAEEFSKKNGGTVTPIHLLAALLECGEHQIPTVLEKLGIEQDDFRKHLKSCMVSK